MRAHRQPASATRVLQHPVDDLLGLAHPGLQVGLASETLGVDLVEILGAGRPGREPAVGRNHLEAADRRVIAWGAREPGEERFAPGLRLEYRWRRELLQQRLLRGARRDVDAGVVGIAELGGQLAIVLARV